MVVLTSRFKPYINSFAQKVLLCIYCRYMIPDEQVVFHEAHLPYLLEDKYVNEQANFREWVP